MSNETQHPTCLVALRHEISDIAHDLETKLKNRVEQVEQAFSYLGWETDQLRSNLKDVGNLQETNASLNARIGNLQDTNKALSDRANTAEIRYRELIRDDNEVIAKHNAKIEELQAALHTMFTPAQVCERVNAVHDELVTKLSAERKELERTQHLLDKMRKDLDEARLSRHALLVEHRGVKNLNRAQGEKIGALVPALDILADMVKDTQAKLEDSEARLQDHDNDYGKLVGEYEDLSKLYDLLRNLILDPNMDRGDRYASFARAMRMGRMEAKTAIHKFVAAHPICTDLREKLDIMVRRTETERTLRPGEVLVPAERLTKAEALHLFKEQAFSLLQCIMNLTSKDISALQYGPHHGHQRLYKHIQAFNRKFAPCFGEREVLREQG